MSTESPKTWFFWSGNALPDPPCYDHFTDDDCDDGDDDDDDGENTQNCSSWWWSKLCGVGFPKFRTSAAMDEIALILTSDRHPPTRLSHVLHFSLDTSRCSQFRASEKRLKQVVWNWNWTKQIWVYVKTYDSLHHPPPCKMFKVMSKKDLLRRFMNISIDSKLEYALRICFPRFNIFTIRP